ncbi:hypothetical protein [Paenibacillus sp. 1011MAR3C5]|uniref:hypothetical protein n=1 Tax=Paenibacillus sp. 1011MAR3C5 TaxID=1675787 RepID=UPI001600574B|nr:hypothetical protein [Paenibacillus sp. 1011MAR3C5]
MNPILFSPTVQVLLQPQSNARLPMLYDSNPYTWPVPVTGIRPPYFTNPRYGWNFPAA